MGKGNSFISVQEALKSGLCRTTLYKLISPRRRGKSVQAPRVRSKSDFRGRRLISSSDLARVLRAGRSRPLTPR